jgi:hypothetical protein
MPPGRCEEFRVNRRLSLHAAIWLFATLVACGSTRSPIIGSWKNQEAIANLCAPVSVSMAFHGDGTFVELSRVPASTWFDATNPKCNPKQWKLATDTGTFAVDAQTIHFTSATGTVRTMFYKLSGDQLTIDTAESLDRDPIHYTRE